MKPIAVALASAAIVIATVLLTADAADVSCGPGSFVSGGVCRPCPAGTYGDRSGLTECIECPARTYSAVGWSSCSNGLGALLVAQLTSMAAALLFPRWCTRRNHSVHPYIPYGNITLPNDTPAMASASGGGGGGGGSAVGAPAPIPFGRKDSTAALEWKNKGNAAYGKGDFREALTCYCQALRFIPCDGPCPGPAATASASAAAATASAGASVSVSGGSSDACVLRSIIYFNRAQSLIQFRHRITTETDAKRGRMRTTDGGDDKDKAKAGADDSPAEAPCDGWIRRALFDCDRSLSANAKYVKPRMLRAELLALTGQFARAVSDFKLIPDSDLTAAARKAYQRSLSLAPAATATPAPASPLPGASDAAPASSFVSLIFTADRHPAIAHANRKVALQNGGGSRGRYLTASSAVATGEVVISEPAFAAVLNRRYRQFDAAARCEWCFRPLTSQSVEADAGNDSGEGGALWWEVCPNCSVAVYCSSDCRSESAYWEHHFECGHPSLFAHTGTGSGTVTEESILALRMWYRSALTDISLAASNAAVPDAKGAVSSKAIPAPASTAPAAAKDSKLSIVEIDFDDESPPPTAATATSAGTVWRGDYGDVHSLLTHFTELSSDDRSRFEAQVNAVFAHFTAAADTKHSATPSSAGESSVDPAAVIGIGLPPLHRSTLLHHIAQTRTNVYAVTAIDIDSQTQNRKHKSKSKSKSQSSEDTSQVRIAVACFPTASLMNHACHPNTIVSFVGRQITVRATQPIRRGEEIVNCYGPHSGHHATAERQRLLRSQYFFDCQCSACASSDGSEALACENPKIECDGHYQSIRSTDAKSPKANAKASTPAPAAAVDRAVRLVCAKCKFECGDVQRLRKFESLAREYFDRGQNLIRTGKPTEAVKVLNHSLQLRIKLFGSVSGHTPNRDVGASYDALGRALAISGDAAGAAECVYHSVCALESIFGRQSIECAREYAKLATLCVNAGFTDRASDAARRALAIFDAVGFGAAVTASASLPAPAAAGVDSSDWRWSEVWHPPPAHSSAIDAWSWPFGASTAERSEYRELQSILRRLPAPTAAAKPPTK